MANDNPFESPQSEITASRVPTLHPSLRILRAISLGILGYAIYAGCVYLSARYFGSESELPATIWMFGVYMAMTFAGSELFVNSRNRSGPRRLAYSLATIIVSLIIMGSLSSILPHSSFLPLRSQSTGMSVQVIFNRALVMGIFFLALATLLNYLRSGAHARASEERSEP